MAKIPLQILFICQQKWTPILALFHNQTNIVVYILSFSYFSLRNKTRLLMKNFTMHGLMKYRFWY